MWELQKPKFFIQKDLQQVPNNKGSWKRQSIRNHGSVNDKDGHGSTYANL
jgi:hypothetical protein